MNWRISRPLIQLALALICAALVALHLAGMIGGKGAEAARNREEATCTSSASKPSPSIVSAAA